MGERVAEVKRNGVGSGISFFQIRRRRGVAGTRGTLAPTEDFIAAENPNITNLKNSFKNADKDNLDAWVDLKLSQTQLDDLYNTQILNADPPAIIDPYGSLHKAQRWKNYQENPDNAGWEYEQWSNSYDGGINRSKTGNQKVVDYANAEGLPRPPWKVEEPFGEPALNISVTITRNGNSQIVTGSRRHDIVNMEGGNKIAVEVKDYTSQNVSKSVDIEVEVRKDLYLLEQGLIDEVRWVFKGQGPTQPLLDLLTTPLPNGKTITVITVLPQ